MVPSPGLVVGSTCSGILGIYALSGCNTVSYLNEKGKVSPLKVLNQNGVTGLDSVLGEMDASEEDLMATATTFFLALYFQKNSNSINAARYDIFSEAKQSTCAAYALASTGEAYCVCEGGGNCFNSLTPLEPAGGDGGYEEGYDERYDE